MAQRLRLTATFALLLNCAILLPLHRAYAQKFNGALRGTIVTVTAQDNETIYQTPVTGKTIFVVTQFCGAPIHTNFFAALDSAKLGSLIHVESAVSTPQRCERFTPGLAIPPGDTLTCQTNTNVNCVLIGVLVKK